MASNKLSSSTNDGSSVDLGRRSILKTAAGAGLLMLLPMLPEYAQAAGTWTGVGKSSTFVIGTPQLVTLKGGLALYVTHKDPKTWIAVTAKCTHHGCQIGWVAADTQFECPCHGAAFGEDGKNLKGTKRNPSEQLPNLQTIPVREHKGNVEVDLSNIPPAVLQPS